MKYLKLVGCILGLIVAPLALFLFIYTFSAILDFWQYGIDDPEVWWVSVAPLFQFLFGIGAPSVLFIYCWRKLPVIVKELVNSRRIAPENRL